MRDEERKERVELKTQRVVSLLLKDFKCLEYGDYLMEELRRVLNKTEKEWTKMLHNAKVAMDAIRKMMPKKSFTHKVNIKLIYSV